MAYSQADEGAFSFYPHPVLQGRGSAGGHIFHGGGSLWNLEKDSTASEWIFQPSYVSRTQLCMPGRAAFSTLFLSTTIRLEPQKSGWHLCTLNHQWNLHCRLEEEDTRPNHRVLPVVAGFTGRTFCSVTLCWAYTLALSLGQSSGQRLITQ